MRDERSNRGTLGVHPDRSGETWATAEALALVSPHLPPVALVVTLQNGLGNWERVATALLNHPDEAIAARLAIEAALREEPGTTRHTGHGETMLGLQGDREECHRDMLAGVLYGAGLRSSVVAAIDPRCGEWRPSTPRSTA